MGGGQGWVLVEDIVQHAADAVASLVETAGGRMEERRVLKLRGEQALETGLAGNILQVHHPRRAAQGFGSRGMKEWDQDPEAFFTVRRPEPEPQVNFLRGGIGGQGREDEHIGFQGGDGGGLADLGVFQVSEAPPGDTQIQVFPKGLRKVVAQGHGPVACNCILIKDGEATVSFLPRTCHEARSGVDGSAHYRWMIKRNRWQP
jgi:hypothetical protein